MFQGYFYENPPGENPASKPVLPELTAHRAQKSHNR
jgi:hypothetical protein